MRLSRRALMAAALASGAAMLCRRPAFAAGTAATDLPLITKPIASSGEKLPVIGIGTNAFSLRSADEQAARVALIQRMLQLGGTVIDTAAIYGGSEAVIGDALASLGVRSKMFVSTKVMARDADAARSQMEESLQHLKTDRVDLMSVHNLVGLDAVLPLVQEWKKSGRVRYVGITTSEPRQHPQMIEAMQKYTLDFIQVDYSLGNRAAADQVLPLAQERKIAVLVNVPFGGRRGANMFPKVAGRALPAWAADFDAQSWGQLFLKYVVSHPAVVCAIPGTIETAHLEDNQRGGRGRLPDAAQRMRLESFWDGLS
ncbi:MAG TPA: aldo/keto reductase [Steroidobacteraceae bacterium]|nr:aldo/keto reductase [Steroidobacteraceae bacterium]